MSPLKTNILHCKTSFSRKTMITLKAQNIMLILKHIKLYFEILKQILCKMHIFSMHGKRLYGGNPQKSLK